MSAVRVDNKEKSLFALTCGSVLLTGFTGLCFQNAWQRYLSVFFGSDAFSTAFVLALFLGGLSLGYFLLGYSVKTSRTRTQSLRRYALIEGGIGLLGAIFPSLAGKLFHSQLPYEMSLMIVGTFVLVTSFFMGGTLPFLLHVWSLKAIDWRRRHILIYGFNSVGAFVGALLSGLVLLEFLGLDELSYFCSVINVVVALLLIFISKRLSEEPPFIESPRHGEILTPQVAMLISFSSGALFLLLENILIRGLKLAFGGHYFIFPLAVSVFTGAIAMGAFVSQSEKLSIRDLQKLLGWALIPLVSIYLAIPYWPLWSFALRSFLQKNDFNYLLFKLFAGTLFAVFAGPLFFFLGRILPLTFLMTEMNPKNYFIRCGQVYGVNALGAIFGGVLSGHLLLTVFNLDVTLKFVMFFIVFLIFFLALQGGLRRIQKIAWILPLFLVVFLPSWNRNSHLRGLATAQVHQPLSFEELWNIKPLAPQEKVEYLRDGPSGTVSVVSFSDRNSQGVETVQARSLAIDGKPDGNTYTDYSTMYLLGALPYVFAPNSKNLKVAVVGLGTGITGGVLAQGQDVAHVDIMEISKEVIESSALFSQENFRLHENAKARILNGDALSFLRRAEPESYDVIVSEPSNPWVVGMENLFSRDTYQILKKALKPQGLMVQWIHTYSMSLESFHIVLKNLKEQFSFVQVYALGQGDLALVAAQELLTYEHLQRRFDEAFFQMSSAAIGWSFSGQIQLSEVLNSEGMTWGRRFENIPEHNFHRPILAIRGSREKFLGVSFQVENLLPADIARRYNFSAEKEKAFSILRDRPQSIELCKVARAAISDFCRRGVGLSQVYEIWTNSQVPAEKRIEAYSILRSEGVLSVQNSFLDDMEKEFTRNEKVALAAGIKIMQERVREGQLEKAQSTLRSWLQINRISQGQIQPLQAWMSARGAQIESLWK